VPRDEPRIREAQELHALGSPELHLLLQDLGDGDDLLAVVEALDDLVLVQRSQVGVVLQVV